MRIKVIAVGSTKWDRLIRRWGVSFLIGEDILFDTFGDPGVFLSNIRKFNIDTAKIKHIIISHDHWDHISGLWYLLNGREGITVYICPGFKQRIKDRIASFGAKVVEVQALTLIKDGVYSTGELVGGSDGEKVYEQSLIIKTTGLTAICGCAHPGVVNIIRHAEESFHEDVHSLIGGFHLKDNTSGQLNAIISELNSCGLKRVAPMHCTGKPATGLFRSRFRDRFIQLKEGISIEV